MKVYLFDKGKVVNDGVCAEFKFHLPRAPWFIPMML
jgi:hypothetical protein